MSIPIITGLGISSAEQYEGWVFTPDQIPGVWPEMEEFVLRSLREANGELSAGDVLEHLLNGGMVAFAAARKGKIELLLVAEIVQYPQYRSANIIVLAGKDVKKAMYFFAAFESWCTASGAVVIEARCHEHQARLFRRLGFHTAYRVIRRNISGRLQ